MICLRFLFPVAQNKYSMSRWINILVPRVKLAEEDYKAILDFVSSNPDCWERDVVEALERDWASLFRQGKYALPQILTQNLGENISAGILVPDDMIPL